jgi:peptide/nickel transport system permease protein
MNQKSGRNLGTASFKSASSRSAGLVRLYFTLRLLAKDKLFLSGLILILFMVVLGGFADSIAPYPNQGGNGIAANPSCPGVPTAPAGICPPSQANPLGTETLGRDLLSRILFGIRTSLLIGAFVVIVSSSIGLTVGLTAGYRGGWIDEGLMRLTDVFLSFPHLLLALLIVATLGPGFQNVFIALGAVWWPSFARLARGQAVSVKNFLFVAAAKSMGVSESRILVRHILPNAIAPVLVLMTLDMGSAILAEAGLSFIGLGVRPPQADLGVMIYESSFFLTTAWWYPLFPGLFLFILVISFNIVGDRIREYFDPRLRRTPFLK